MKNQKTNLEKLEAIFQREFGPPFLEEGVVDAFQSFGTLWIRMGRRDVNINEKLEVVGAGICLVPPYKEIKKEEKDEAIK